MEQGRGKEIEISNLTGVSVERLLRTKNDSIRCRLDLLNIETASCRNAEPTSLSWGIKCNPFMLAQCGAGSVNEGTRLLGFGSFLLKKRAIVPVADKANFLAFLQLIDREAHGLSFSPYF